MAACVYAIFTCDTHGTCSPLAETELSAKFPETLEKLKDWCSWHEKSELVGKFMGYSSIGFLITNASQNDTVSREQILEWAIFAVEDMFAKVPKDATFFSPKCAFDPNYGPSSDDIVHILSTDFKSESADWKFCDDDRDNWAEDMASRTPHGPNSLQEGSIAGLRKAEILRRDILDEFDSAVEILGLGRRHSVASMQHTIRREFGEDDPANPRRIQSDLKHVKIPIPGRSRSLDKVRDSIEVMKERQKKARDSPIQEDKDKLPVLRSTVSRRQ